MKYEEKTMKSEKIYDGRILSLRVDTIELPNRSYSRREIVEHDNCVVMIPFIDKDHVIMVKQYRKAIEKLTLEFPAGKIDSGEGGLEAANRELQEEIGYGANNLEYIYDFYTSPGFTDEKLSLYIATDLYESNLEPDEDEFIEIVTVEVDELISMLDSYQLNDAKTIIGALYLKTKREATCKE